MGPGAGMAGQDWVSRLPLPRPGFLCSVQCAGAAAGRRAGHCTWHGPDTQCKHGWVGDLRLRGWARVCLMGAAARANWGAAAAIRN